MTEEEVEEEEEEEEKWRTIANYVIHQKIGNKASPNTHS